MKYPDWKRKTRLSDLDQEGAMGVVEEPGLMQRHRLTIDEYYRMAEAGVLAPDARVELIEGEIVDRAPMKSRHAGVIAHLT